MGDVIAEDVKWKLEAIPGVTKAKVDLVLDPPWSMEMMTEEARMEMGMF
jgi:metal-sulfur cluster biosynthetic enzyme